MLFFCIYGFAGDSPAQTWFYVLVRHDTKREEAAVFTVCRVIGPLHMSHHNRGLLQKE